MNQGIPEITQVRRMLEALLKSDNHIHWIGGYVYGRTSNDEPFVILYPAAPYLNEKAVRVYPHDFGKLPTFIPTDEIEGDTDANPSKDKAKKRGIYHVCPMFKIVTYNGKDTQMGPEKRFGDVLLITDKMPQDADETAVPSTNGTRPAPAQTQAPPPPGPPVDSRGPMSPAAQADRKPGKPQTPEWEFYTAVAKANHLYQNAKQVKEIADRINPAWKHGQSPADDLAMGNALAEYAKKRADLEAAGKDKKTCHNQALGAAIKMYNAVTAAA